MVALHALHAQGPVAPKPPINKQHPLLWPKCKHALNHFSSDIVQIQPVTVATVIPTNNNAPPEEGTTYALSRTVAIGRAVVGAPTAPARALQADWQLERRTGLRHCSEILPKAPAASSRPNCTPDAQIVRGVQIISLKYTCPICSMFVHLHVMYRARCPIGPRRTKADASRSWQQRWLKALCCVSV